MALPRKTVPNWKPVFQYISLSMSLWLGACGLSFVDLESVLLSAGGENRVTEEDCRTVEGATGNDRRRCGSQEAKDQGTRSLVCTGLRGVQTAFGQSAGRQHSSPVDVDNEHWSNLAITLTYTPMKRQAELVFEDRIDLKAVVRTIPMYTIMIGDRLSFVAMDALHREAILLTYAPQTGKVIWSGHRPGLLGTDVRARGRLLIGTCQAPSSNVASPSE